MTRRQGSMTDFKGKINRFDSFTKCKSLILGQINWTLVDLIQDPDKRDYTYAFLEDFNETLEFISNICKKFNIHVDRPTVVPYDEKIKYVHPNFELSAVKNPISPSDSFLCLSDTIVEVASVQETAFFDYVQYRDIWNRYFDNGSKWMAAPIPTHDPKQWNGFDYFDFAEPLFDGACVEPVGNKAFISNNVVMNPRGKKWLERMFPEYEFIIVPKTRGHLDSFFRILKPGVIYSAIGKSDLPECFKNWTLIEAIKTEYQPPEIVSEFLQDDDYDNTVLDVNGFSIDEENFLMMEHTFQQRPEVVRQIESHGVNCIPVPFDSCRFLNQGMACIMNATHREGSLFDYFK